MTVYVLHGEGNVDYYSEVLGVYATQASADKARQAAVVAAHDDGYYVEGDDADADEEWDRSFLVRPFEVQE